MSEAARFFIGPRWLRETSARRRGAWLLLALCALVGVVMMLSSGQMRALRFSAPPLSRFMSWLEGWPGPFDMDHVAFFTAVGIGLRLVFPRWPWWRSLLLLAALGAGTELMQFASQGRTPHWQDARDDVLGGMLGLAICALAQGCARWVGSIRLVAAALLLLGTMLLPWSAAVWGRVFGYPLLAFDALFALALGLRLFVFLSGRAPLHLSWMPLAVGLILAGLLTLLLLRTPGRDVLVAQGLACPRPSAARLAAWTVWLGTAWQAAMALLVWDAIVSWPLASSIRVVRIARLRWPLAAVALALLVWTAWGAFAAVVQTFDMESLLAALRWKWLLTGLAAGAAGLAWRHRALIVRPVEQGA
ncbi:VanZ family protein [Thermomonas sp.]|uniref:VanZ family protein n=1 Tax=Thermomonas sp. TaxID=1971895 RepID=UPI002622B57A|nr:VanZ family protein [Thermomonas sp.]MCO5054634.1 VanZ family protein [Thermomonas sp.]